MFFQVVSLSCCRHLLRELLQRARGKGRSCPIKMQQLWYKWALGLISFGGLRRSVHSVSWQWQKLSWRSSGLCLIILLTVVGWVLMLKRGKSSLRGLLCCFSLLMLLRYCLRVLCICILLRLVLEISVPVLCFFLITKYCIYSTHTQHTHTPVAECWFSIWQVAYLRDDWYNWLLTLPVLLFLVDTI